MEHYNPNIKKDILTLVIEYEAMSQKEKVYFIEETAFMEIINFYEDEDHQVKAFDALQDALSQHPYSVELYLKKAQMHLEVERKEYDDAFAALDKAEAFAPNTLAIDLLRITIYCEIGEADNAFDIVEMLYQRNNTAVALSDIYLHEARIHGLEEDYDEMFEMMKKSVNANPKNDDAYPDFWFSVEFSHRYDEGIVFLLEIINLHPYSYYAWYNLGQAYVHKNEYEEAIEAYEYSFLINDKFILAYEECAELCFDLKYYTRALKHYQEILKHTEPTDEILVNIGKCYSALGQDDVAKVFYLKATSIEPYNDEAYFYFGNCMAREDKWETAISSYIKALEIHEGCDEYEAALAEAYHRVGEYTLALKHYRLATELAPDESKYWIQYAGFLMENGFTAEALDILDEAEDNAYDPSLIYCRAACLFREGRRQEAMETLNEALEDDFDMYNSLFCLAPELLEDKEIMAAIAYFSE
jgi:tetratricopeptide (TPR) repeat protein